MIFKLGPIETSDILVIINIFITSVFSFLLWRATVAANETAIAIKESSKREKKMIENQNRTLFNFNIVKIENILLSHSEEKGFPRNSKDKIQMAIKEIREFDLALYFGVDEIEKILEFVNYIEQDFMNIFRKSKVYSHNPLHAKGEDLIEYREEVKKFNRKEIPKVQEAISRIEELKKNIH